MSEATVVNLVTSLGGNPVPLLGLQGFAGPPGGGLRGESGVVPLRRCPVGGPRYVFKLWAQSGPGRS